MTPAQRTQHPLRLALALAAFLISGKVAAGPIDVDALVTDLGTGLFRYEYTIANNTSDDAVLMSIFALPNDNSLTNLFAPVGFFALYDLGLGIVDFAPDLGSFDLFAAGTTLAGFGFESALPPGTARFEALTLAGDILGGFTQAPAVPEPGTIALAVLALGALGASRKLSQHPLAE